MKKTNDAIKIEKNIKPPTSGIGRYGRVSAALLAMREGDSFMLDKDDVTVRNSIYQTARRLKIPVMIRKVAEGEARLLASRAEGCRMTRTNPLLAHRTKGL